MVPGLRIAGGLHQFATDAKQTHGLVERQSTSGDERGILAKRVASDVGGRVQQIRDLVRLRP